MKKEFYVALIEEKSLNDMYKEMHVVHIMKGHLQPLGSELTLWEDLEDGTFYVIDEKGNLKIDKKNNVKGYSVKVAKQISYIDLVQKWIDIFEKRNIPTHGALLYLYTLQKKLLSFDFEINSVILNMLDTLVILDEDESSITQAQNSIITALFNETAFELEQL